jgi:hypothetical protein
MQPTPDKLLGLIATKIMTQLMPEANDYQKGDLMLLAGVIRAVAERYEHDADIYLWEHRAVRAIFQQASADADACAAFGATVLTGAAREVLDDFRMSALRQKVETQLRLLGSLHEWSRSHERASTWLKPLIDKFLADRVVLRALECGPYTDAALSDIKQKILRA